MTLQTILEQNRERLMSAISGADTVSAIRVLNSELDRILYTFNDQEEDARIRAAASSMIQVAKASCSLVDSSGETKIYGRTEYGEDAAAKKGMPMRVLILLIVGLIGAAATVVGLQMLATSVAAHASDWQSAGLPPRYLLAAVPLLSAAAFFLAGLLLKRGKDTSKERLHAETKTDSSKVYSHLLSMMLVMDKSLEEIRVSAKQEDKEHLREQASAMDPAELELLSQMLENAYGRRGEDGQADEEISQIRFYLHRKNIDVVDWSPDTLKRSMSEGGGTVDQSGWFDMMPAYSSGTLRPALICDGKLLKKGLASAS